MDTTVATVVNQRRCTLSENFKTPGCDEYDVVLVAPPSLQLFYIQQCHDAPAAEHLGSQTLERL